MPDTSRRLNAIAVQNNFNETDISKCLNSSTIMHKWRKSTEMLQSTTQLNVGGKGYDNVSSKTQYYIVKIQRSNCQKNFTIHMTATMFKKHFYIYSSFEISTAEFTLLVITATSFQLLEKNTQNVSCF